MHKPSNITKTPRANFAQATRRRSLKILGLGLLAGCSGPAARLVGGDSGAAKAASGLGDWSTGGAQALSKLSSIPNPFLSASEACSLTCEQILGPCYAPKAPLRQDISEGEPGIPMRLAFRLVGVEDCAPIAGAEVEVWHTSQAGFYSADDVEGGDFCTSDDQHAEASYFFRGRAISDDDGQVAFDSCYPGWYSSRAVHIHVLVRMPDDAGSVETQNAQVVTQFYFDENMTEQIFADIDGYSDRGQPDTPLSRDGVMRGGAEAAQPFIFDVEQLNGGAMLASKTISISAGESCGSRGFGGGFGGPPRGGFPRRGQ